MATMLVTKNGVKTPVTWVRPPTSLLGTKVSSRVSVSGTPDAIILTTGQFYGSVPPTGTRVRFRATATNTGATTITVDNGIARNCRTPPRDGASIGVALPAGFIRTDVDTEAEFDGTYWIVFRRIETGVDATNGRWTRFEDGTQHCFSNDLTADVSTATGSGFRSAVQTWTFAKAFSSTIGLVVTSNSQANSSSHWSGARAAGVSTAEVTLFAFTSTTGRTARAEAKGRWF